MGLLLSPVADPSPFPDRPPLSKGLDDRSPPYITRSGSATDHILVCMVKTNANGEFYTDQLENGEFKYLLASAWLNGSRVVPGLKYRSHSTGQEFRSLLHR